jgi:multidrug resistance efflux pump
MTQIQDRTTQAPTIDQPPAAAAPPRRRGTTIRKWRNRFLVLAMTVVAAATGLYMVRAQAASDAKLKLGELMLTSQPIPIEPSLPGLVTEVSVKAGQRVAAGQQVGAVRVTTTNSSGHAVLSKRVLRAPRAGVVVDDPLTIGSTLQPGTGFVVLYDPADLRLVTDLPLSYLPEVAPGMTAELHAKGVSGTVNAVLDRAVPRVGTSQDDVAPDHLQLVFRPQNAAEVSGLIPGLRFTGSLDTRTGRQGSQPVVFVK